MSGPCDWPTIGCDGPAWDAMADSGHADAVVDAAVTKLWNWTGRAFGLCTVTVRPCRQGCDLTWSTYTGPGGTVPSGPSPWLPALIGGEWRNLRCGWCGDRCGCDTTSTVVLPGPVHAVDTVTIDGDELDGDAWRLDPGGLLVRTDGQGWPTAQHLSADPGTDGTWEVTYQWGRPVPTGGQIAAGVLAVEMAKAMCGGPCQLPTRVQTITREGVTVAAILDAFDGLDRGRTGLWLVDSWVAEIVSAPARPRVYSPDVPRTRTVT